MLEKREHVTLKSLESTWTLVGALQWNKTIQHWKRKLKVDVYIREAGLEKEQQFHSCYQDMILLRLCLKTGAREIKLEVMKTQKYGCNTQKPVTWTKYT